MRFPTVTLGGAEVPKVEEFKYLGSTVQADGGCTKEDKKTSEGRMERMEENVGTVMWQKSTSKSEGKNSSDCSSTQHDVWLRDSGDN